MLQLPILKPFCATAKAKAARDRTFGLSDFRTHLHIKYISPNFDQPIYEHTKAFSFFPWPHFNE
jgi:hypothetical protein